MTRYILAIAFPIYIGLMGAGCWLIMAVAESIQ